MGTTRGVPSCQEYARRAGLVECSRSCATGWVSNARSPCCDGISSSFTDLYTKRWRSYAGRAQRGWVEEVGWHGARRDERVRVGPAAPHRSAAAGVPTVGLPRHGEERVRIQVQPPGDGDRPAVASLDAYSHEDDGGGPRILSMRDQGRRRLGQVGARAEQDGGGGERGPRAGPRLVSDPELEDPARRVFADLAPLGCQDRGRRAPHRLRAHWYAVLLLLPHDIAARVHPLLDSAGGTLLGLLVGDIDGGMVEHAGSADRLLHPAVHGGDGHRVPSGVWTIDKIGRSHGRPWGVKRTDLCWRCLRLSGVAPNAHPCQAESQYGDEGQPLHCSARHCWPPLVSPPLSLSRTILPLFCAAVGAVTRNNHPPNYPPKLSAPSCTAVWVPTQEAGISKKRAGTTRLPSCPRA